MEYNLLDSVASPENLRRIPEEDIPKLCEQIREFLIENSLRTGGHLASNLGVTELSVALHRVFDSPKDHIIFDVGHQAYVHKMLTGRRDRFSELRQPGGLSGFTLRRESEHDPFGAGHSSTSISASLGFAEADALSGNDAYSVCVVGDGACTGGMIHEALNNCRSDLKLIIILNENRMSISKNKGAFAQYIAKMRMSKGYRRWKSGTNNALEHTPLIGKPIRRMLSFFKGKLKRIVYSNNYFEELGLYYIGPVDGNDYAVMEQALRRAKELGKCTVIHAYTKKGKGYEPAELSPDDFHSVSGDTVTPKTLHGVFADELVNMAKENERTVAVTAAMGKGTGLSYFGEQFPKRYFDVGIAEEHALTFSAGLAASGMNPYVAIYSTFLQRGYDNIIHDIALQNLPVRIMIDRAGLAVSDGATHHGIFDVAFLSHIPNITLFAPVTYGTLCEAMHVCDKIDGPTAIRYANSSQLASIKERFYSDECYSRLGAVADFDPNESPEALFVTYGNITDKVISAERSLSERGVRTGIVLVEKLRPYSDSLDLLYPLIKNAKSILFVEEGIKIGGYAMTAAALLREKYSDFAEKRIAIAAIDDTFASPEQKCDIYDFVGLSSEKISERMLDLIG